jgi:hypothetical protein
MWLDDLLEFAEQILRSMHAKAEVVPQRGLHVLGVGVEHWHAHGGGQGCH